MATLALDGVPRQLGLRVEQQQGEGEEEAGAVGVQVFTVLAVCDDGAVRVVRRGARTEGEGEVMDGGDAAPVQMLRVVKGGSSGSSSKKKAKKKAPDVFGLAACLLPGGGGAMGGGWRCALVHGAEAAPLFERFSYATGGGVGDLLLPAVAVAGLEKEEGEGEGPLAVEKGSQKRKRGEGAAAVAVAPEDPAGKTAAVDGSMVAGAGEEASVPASAAAARGGGAQQRTIGSRLGEMAEAAAAAAAASGGGGVLEKRAAQQSQQPKADSLVTVLTQALKSSDEELLEQCLLVHDAHVVSTTVQLLPPQLTLPLVETLVRKLERRPNRAATICPWVRFLLLHHTSYLVSVPSLHKRLAGLHQLATRRVAVLPRLLGLAGRRELMLSQISKQGDGGGGGGGGQGEEVEVYDDNEEGEEEEEEGLAAEEEESEEEEEEDDGMDEEEEEKSD